MSNRFTTKEFVEESIEMHGNKYDYSKSVYGKSNMDELIIICPLHGMFLQRPINHLNGRGCPKCGRIITEHSRRRSRETFIVKSNTIHNNRYSYDEVIYVNDHTKVKIKCPVHGIFLQSPNAHLSQKQGCPPCGLEKNTKSRSDTTAEFVEKSKCVHENRYDYSETVYVNTHTNVVIICKKHGPFLQLPLNHLKRNGCPKCKMSYGECQIIKFLEKNHVKCVPQYTFGDCRNPKTNAKLKFDFYIPSKNLLIEYDGLQHFIVGKFGKHKSSSEALRLTKYRDRLKTKYAKSHGIKLLRIKYTELNKIPQILSERVA